MDNIDSLISKINFNNSLVNCGSIMLTNDEIRVLRKFNIDYLHCSTLKEVLYEIERIGYDEAYFDPELEMISLSISERDYYQNTSK